MGVVFLIVIIVIAVWVLASCVRIVPQAYAVILERLGAYQATWSTGIHFKVPFIERVARKVNLKEQVVDFPPQPVITKDNVTMQIDTVVFFQVYIDSYSDENIIDLHTICSHLGQDTTDFLLRDHNIIGPFNTYVKPQFLCCLCHCHSHNQCQHRRILR